MYYYNFIIQNHITLDWTSQWMKFMILIKNVVITIAIQIFSKKLIKFLLHF